MLWRDTEQMLEDEVFCTVLVYSDTCKFIADSL